MLMTIKGALVWRRWWKLFFYSSEANQASGEFVVGTQKMENFLRF